MVDVKIKIALELIAIMILAAPIAIAQEVPPHLVISEVFYDESGTDNNEFCELYNPTDSAIDIGDWTLNAFNQAGALKTTTTFPTGTTIDAHKFYLIGEKNPLNSSDWAGTAISPDCLRGGSDWQNGPDDYLVLEDSGGNYIDGVRWGHKDGNNPPPIADVPDNNTAPDAAAGESIERKPLDGGYAPCQDTDNNSFDFVVQDTPTPKNSSSSETGISVTKESSVTEGVPSTNVNFTINVTNTGDCTLNPVKVVDTLPAGMSYVATGTSPAPSRVHGNTITWNNVGPLDPGASTMISLIAHIDTGAEGTLRNLVNAAGKPPAGDNVTDSDTADVTVFEPDIVVISEVFYDESSTDINEFCELYNPSDSDIDIGDWTLNAFNEMGVLKTITTFPDDANITAHKFYLIGEKDPLNSSDWAGTAISPDCLRGGTDWQNGPDDYLVLEDSGGNYIDGVRWGHKDGNNPPPIADVPDNNTAPDAAAGKSIERKPLDGGYAPCQDTDNNSFDFVVQDTPTPKNSSSSETGISVTKVSSVTEGVPSTNVNFTINVTNTGDCTLNPVKVVDTLPAGMSYVATGTSPAPSIVHGNTITWNNVGPLDPGASTMISLIAHIDTGAEGTLTNLVNATGKPPAGDNVTDSDTAAVTVLELDIVVISEVFYDESGTDNNEFCELYNPTDSDIDIGDWTLNAFNEMGVLKTITTFPDDAIITAHKFYLIGEKNPLNSSDWAGTAISPDCLRGGTDWQNGPDDYLVLEDSGGNYIDGVRWGHKDGNNPPPIPDVPDNNTAPDAAAGKSIERKPLDGGYAPCQDTDNNSFDFVVQDTPTPKNSSSSETGISVTKVSSVTEGVPSSNVNFTINVTNTGDCTLNPVKVVDTLPAGMSYVATGTSPAPSIVHENTITWNNVGPLDPGASTMISLIAHIDTGAEGTLTNIVNATGKPPAGDNVTDSDTAAVTVFEPDIVVISEVFYDESGTDNNEFCELYNPTDSDIDIGDWTLNAFNEMGVLKTTTTFPDDAIITAHKFYLIGEKNPLNSSDWAGTAISPDCLRGGTDWQNGPDDYLVLEDSGGNYIDGVRWGHKDGNNPPPIADVPDNNTAPDAAKGKSIERKPLDGGYAPCQDTDNNSFDFVVQDTPTPKNSSSSETCISVTKVSSVTEGVPSSNVNFTINVTNTGDCTLNPVKVVDTLPAGMSYVATGTSPAPSIVHENTITWNNVGPLDPGASTMISLIAHIDTGAEGTLRNLVNATGKPPAGDNVTDSDTAAVTVFEPDIVVISEVFYDESGTDNNEFCELYNPSDSDIDIGDWTLNAFNEMGVLKTITTFPDDAIITAHKFYLIGEKNPLNSNDWAGTAISPDCLRGGTDWQNGPDDYLVLEDSGGNYIDGVRWGHKDGNNPPPIADVPDNNTAPDAAKGKSIERKPLDGGYAPCQDTDNNALDFVVQDTPTPKNSSCLETGISVTKVGDVTVAAPSTLVYFNITVSNTGKCRLKHVLVEDTLPAGMSYAATGTSPAPSIVHGNTITWNDVGPLAAGASKTIKLVAPIEEDAEGVLTNTVKVTGTPWMGTNVYNDATAEVRVILLEIKKSCKSSTVSLGKTVKYTIEYSNPGEVDLTNVVIIENYPKNLTFISANPAPDFGTNNKWTICTLPAGESGKITIKMKVPASMSDLSYTESGSVSGEGIVMISKELSTKVEPFDLENIVTISGSYKETNVSATASAITTVGVSGSSLEITEHGSGTYDSEEELSVSPERMGIKFDKTTNAEYSPTTFKCSDGFVMEVPSKWSQDICIKNYVKKSAIHKTITEATYMNDNTIIKSDNKGYSMDFDSSFLGYLHVDKKTKDAATSEHYIGKFVITDWDESGDEIVDGVGYVIVDKELASGRLLLMEHGSGSYSSEEDSSSSSIDKITYAEYEPTSFNFSDSFVVNFSSKWMQDFCTRSRTGTIALHKKIRDATYIDDDTRAKSSPSLKFDTFFYGATHVGSRSRYSRSSEDYIGEFYVSWAAITDCTFVFDWGEVPGDDEDELIMHLSEPRFGMPWVTEDDVEITKPVKDTIDIFTPEHSAEIILDTKTNETAELIVPGVEPYTFKVEKHGKKLKVFDCVLERKPEEVSGEGFVMLDEAIFSDGGEIQVTEHGSGIYYSHEDFNSKAIEKETYGKYKPTYFDFSDSFSVNFSSMWLHDICAKDEDEGTALHKKISDASFMKDNTIAKKASLDLNSSFTGSMHIGARTENVSISEDYIGQFDVTQLIKIVKEKPHKKSSKTSDWLFCPCPIPSSTYPWFCQDPTYRGRWLSVCPYPYKDHWLYIHP